MDSGTNEGGRYNPNPQTPGAIASAPPHGNSNAAGPVIVGLIAVVVGIAGFVAGHAMQGITSVSGDSIAEAYYQAMGTFAIAVVGLLLAVVALLVLGLLREDKNSQIIALLKANTSGTPRDDASLPPL